MKNSKKIFFTIITIFSLLFLSAIILVITSYYNGDVNTSEPIASLIILPLILLLIFGVIYLIGHFVFMDSKKRGMDPWLWTMVALFVPNLVGLIIYLVVRNSYTKTMCKNCGNPVDDHFMNCPFCGFKLKDNCNSCGLPVEAEWNICPKCASKLK